MQSLYLLGRNSSDCRGGGGGGCGLFSVPSASRRLASFVGMWAHTYTTRGRRRKPSDRTSAVAAAAAGGEQDHYAVLGIVRTATAADIKRAYRLLARQYHPDVSRDLRAGEIFKKIHWAYEVLSDDVARAQYDISLNSPIPRANSWNTWSSYSESDEVLYRWAKQRHQRHYKRQDKYGQNTWYYKPNSQQETSSYERGSFGEVLRFTFFTLLFMQFIGHRASLTLCGAAAMLDNQLDVGYKMGYAVALLFGGRRGVLLALCIYFTSWLCGKKNSSLVALVVLAMWAGAHIARFAPIPQGAVLTLLYMSIKLHVDSK